LIYSLFFKRKEKEGKKIINLDPPLLKDWSFELGFEQDDNGVASPYMTRSKDHKILQMNNVAMSTCGMIRAKNGLLCKQIYMVFFFSSVFL
jgi:hypothetical protein